MPDLKQVCYKHIKDSFYYGLFGDFKLVIDKDTGCFNATKLCDMTGKNFFNWKRLQHSKALIEYYKIKGSPSDLKGYLYEIRLQNNDTSNKQITGQYICKELFLSLSTWISIEFYDKCSKIVLDYYAKENPDIKIIENSMSKLKIENEKKEATISQQKDKIDELLELVKSERKQAAERHEELLTEIEDLQVNVEDVHSRLDTATDDRVPKTTQNSIQERFILLKKNIPNGGYYCIRGQNVYVNRKLKLLSTQYPRANIILDLTCQPNPRNLFLRFKELNDDRFTIRGNNISTTSERVLIQILTRLNDEKKNI